MVIPVPRTVNERAGGQAGWVVLALGSNLGEREGFLDLARRRLSERGFRQALSSPVEETEPLGGPPGQPRFLNQVVAQRRREVALAPRELLRVCQQIEDEAGRVRVERWGPRTLDIDLLLFGDLVLNSPELVVPHPELLFRPFLLRPLARLLPDLVHPVVRETFAALAARACPAGPPPRSMPRGQS